jgi:hypothetical protein
MFLIFDCSSISRPTDYKAPFTDISAWPRLLHLSWILLDAKLQIKEDFDCIVKPEGWELTEEILKYAHLELEEVQKKSVEVDDILDKFNASCEKANYILAHNIKFNESIVAAESMRRVKPLTLLKKEKFCLMQEGTYFCKLPAKGGGYKWPTLNELHITIFEKGYTPANNARADVIASARCFINLMKTGQLEDMFE